MKDNKLIKLSFKKIKVSFKRFFSLVILSVLGVSFFVGMKISMPSLLVSLDKYFKDTNVFDVEIVSSNGLNQEDISAISNLDKNIDVYGLHFKDTLFNDKALNTDVIRIKELNNHINRVNLIDGRFPVNNNEILIDEKYFLKPNAKLGDELELVLDDKDNDLTVKKVVIVGVINSPLYLATDEGSLNRGNTLIGNGEIKYYAYALNSIFNMDYYTEIYIDNKASNMDVTNSDEYNKKTNKIIKKIDSIKEERVKYRHEELKKITLERIKQEEEKITKEINDSKTTLNDIKLQLDNAKKELDTRKQELDNANYQLKAKENEINRIDNAIKTGEIELQQKKKALDDTKNSINDYDNLLRVAKKNQNNALTKDDIISILPDDSEKEENIQKIELASQVGADLSNLGNIRRQVVELGIDADGSLVAKIDKWQEGLDAVLAVDNGYTLYNTKMTELNSYKSALDNAKATYNNYVYQYKNGHKIYENALNEYNQRLNQYNAAASELIEKENGAKKEFEKMKKEVEENLVPGTWLIHRRLDNVDYSGFMDSIESLEKLSFIFPIIFFVVAVFISLLSMARMGIEDRGEMGTLKAIGFSKVEILTQYIVYSLSATVIGSILGVIIGTLFLPKMVFSVYTNLYALPKMVYTNFISILVIGVIITIVCIVGSTMVSIINILKERTISLLRPVAPPIGKRILLEKIPFFWDKMTFESKVTARNIFRYKRRVLMTLVGIVSCTMILVSAFLIRDSITTVLDIQFKEIFTYDSMIYLDGSKLSYELGDSFKSKHIKKSMYTDLERVKIGKTSVNLIVPNNVKDLNGLIKLRNKSGKLNISNDGVVITSKIAKMYNIKVNDLIKIKMTDNREYDIKVNAITENYIGHYIYMSKESYEKIIGLYRINTVFLKLDNKNNEEMVVEKLLQNNKNILSYLSINNNIANVKNMFTSLDKVVLIVVIFSLLLSVVILYSLAYIIISERQREIATLKVLGFDQEEVDIYLLKEQAIIVTWGILIGLIIGIFYSLFLVNTLEVNIVQFNKDLLFRNFIVCILLMIVFASIVGQLIHFRLKKINMIEALKSVE